PPIWRPMRRAERAESTWRLPMRPAMKRTAWSRVLPTRISFTASSTSCWRGGAMRRCTEGNASARLGGGVRGWARAGGEASGGEQGVELGIDELDALAAHALDDHGGGHGHQGGEGVPVGQVDEDGEGEEGGDAGGLGGGDGVAARPDEHEAELPLQEDHVAGP